MDGLSASSWNELVDRSTTGTAFHRFEWLSEWWKTRSIRDELAILTVKDEAKLIGVAAMYVPHGGERRYLRMMGESNSDYCNFLFDPDCEDVFWDTAADEIAAFCKRGNLHGVIAHDVPTDHLVRHFEMRGLAPRRLGTTLCPYCVLPSTWDAFVGTLGKKNRQEIPRYFRRLEKNYSVEYGSSHFDPAARERALEALFALHTIHWQLQGQPGALGLDVREFHRRVAATSEQLRLYDIRIEGEIRAVFYGYFYKQKMWAYLTGVDPDFAKDHLGALIFGYAIKKTIEEGGYEFDLTRGDELYKTQTWNARRDRYNSNIIVPLSLRSRLALKLSRENVVPGLALRDFARSLRARLRG